MCTVGHAVRIRMPTRRLRRTVGHAVRIHVAPAVLAHLVDDKSLQGPREGRHVERPDPVVGDEGPWEGEARKDDERQQQNRRKLHG